MTRFRGEHGIAGLWVGPNGLFQPEQFSVAMIPRMNHYKMKCSLHRRVDIAREESRKVTQAGETPQQQSGGSTHSLGGCVCTQ